MPYGQKIQSDGFEPIKHRSKDTYNIIKNSSQMHIDHNDSRGLSKLG